MHAQGNLSGLVDYCLGTYGINQIIMNIERIFQALWIATHGEIVIIVESENICFYMQIKCSIHSELKHRFIILRMI